MSAVSIALHGASLQLGFECDLAMALGEDLDLTGCSYERDHARDYQPPGYYRLLAGLMAGNRLFGSAGVAVEIGSYCLGAATAMHRAGADVITVDIKAWAPERVVPGITQVIGNSLEPETVERVREAVAGRPVGLLYIDSAHTYRATTTNLELYRVLQPACVVLDDIRLNDSMRELWMALTARYPHYDASELVDRPCGFGVLSVR
jgi:hypothetical protein